MGLFDRRRLNSLNEEDGTGGGGDGTGNGGGGYVDPIPAVPGTQGAPVTPGATTAAGVGGAGGYSGLSGGPTFNFPDLPGFTPPQFAAPTFADALNEPGYQFRSQAGMDAIEGSAAARGVLRTGGTLKDLGAWNQDFASQEYGNVYNRALSSFDRDYRGAYDAFQPQMTRWSTMSQAEIAAAMARYNREWQQYTWQGGGGGGGGGADMAAMPVPRPAPAAGGGPGYGPGSPGYEDRYGPGGR